MIENRIAILIIGLPRWTYDVKSNLFNFFIPSHLKDKTDLFFCTWFDYDFNYKKLNEYLNFKVLDISTQCLYTNNFINNFNEFKEFCKFYKNESYEYKLFSEDAFNKNAHINGVYQLYLINRGFNIIKNYALINNIRYDVVIKSRLDLEFLHTFTDEIYENTIKSNNTFFGRKHLHVNIPDSNIFSKYTNNWVDDVYFYSKFDTFEKISKIYDQYYDIATNHNTWITHIWFDEFLKQNNINFEKSPITTQIIRPDNTWFRNHFN